MKRYRIVETRNRDGSSYFWPEHRRWWGWDMIMHVTSHGYEMWLCQTLEQAKDAISKFDADRNSGPNFAGEGVVKIHYP